MNRSLELLRLVRFSHTLFALPWAGVGVLLALPVEAPFRLLLLVLACMVLARTAAMCFNRLVDRHLDASNPRTAGRASVTGRVSPAFMTLAVLGCSAGFVASAFGINSACGWLSPVALLVVLGYSLTKRWTRLCHWVLGAGLGLAPVGAFLALRGAFDEGTLAVVFIGLAVMFWTAGFDILYALADMAHDRQEKLHSIPAHLGVKGALLVARCSHAAMVLLLVAAILAGGLGVAFMAGVVLAAVLLIHEHRLLAGGDLSRLETAFFKVNVSLGFVMFTATALDRWMTWPA